MTSALDFTAISFETANRIPGSVVAVGIARVRAGEGTFQDSWLITPPIGVELFEDAHVRAHGITPEALIDASRDWVASLARIEQIRDGSPMITHDAVLHRAVYEEATRAVDMVPPTVRWEDTRRLARQHLVLPDYDLPTVWSHFGFEGLRHRHAGADALGTALIARRLAEQTEAADMDELWPGWAGSSRPIAP